MLNDSMTVFVLFFSGLDEALPVFRRVFDQHGALVHELG